ncbi:MAG: anti-sigma factor [Hyphomicrobiaceae bacterium]|nr:anti-sigma factor [Hyphomicrobiaceae bacterium]
MSDATDRRAELHDLAGEYVLGLASDAERAAFEQMLSHDVDAREALAVARERFLELDTSALPVPPTPELWARIETALERPQTSDRPDNIVPFTGRRDASANAAVPGGRVSRRAFWQGFAAASLLATLGGGLGLYQIAQRKPRMIVVLLDATAQPVSIVETYEGQRIRIVPLIDIAVPEGKTLQVWTLPSRETGPVSMGLMHGPAVTTLDGPTLPPPKPDQLYEITIEQAGGSPTGKPTGPIVGKGFAKLPHI